MDTTNKPVAWIPKDHLKEMGKAGFRYTAVSYQEDKFYCIPLYTHPVKELTDEEIMNIVADKYEKGHGRYSDTELFFVEFARAILKKAQEKCNGFCGEYECKENQAICKRKAQEK